MKKNWNANDIQDLTGRMAIVTGANSGIGYETARALALRGANVILACRNATKAQTAVDQIRSEGPTGTAAFMELDLSSLASIRAFTEAFKAEHSRLDLLINNAGIMMPATRQTTTDGFEVQFGVNHLGHFQLTLQLLDLLKTTPKARVVTVSSVAHQQGSINFDDLNSESSYGRIRSYGQSKLANLLFTLELQRQLDEEGADVIAVAAHPGWTATNLQQHVSLFKFLNNFLAQSPEDGALPTLYAAVGDDVKGGDYYGPGGFLEWKGSPDKADIRPHGRDAAIARQLWNVSTEMTATA